jgi:hypothetical protein
VSAEHRDHEARDGETLLLRFSVYHRSDGTGRTMLTHAELNLAQVIRLLVYESQRIAVVASATEAAVRALHERN